MGGGGVGVGTDLICRFTAQLVVKGWTVGTSISG